MAILFQATPPRRATRIFSKTFLFEGSAGTGIIVSIARVVTNSLNMALIVI